MNFTDLNINGSNFDNDLALAKEAMLLGWKFVFFTYSPNNYKNALEYINDLQEEINNIYGNNSNNNSNVNNTIKVDMALKIVSKNSNELQKAVKKYRDTAKLIFAQGNDVKINRAACENIKVDILSRPYIKDRGCGLNHVLAKEAVKNNVAIELCVYDILNSYLSPRAKFLANFREIIKFYNKFNFPLIISSGAKSIFDLKSPRDLEAIFTSLGLSNQNFNNAISNTPNNIIDFASKRSTYIAVGVRELNIDDIYNINNVECNITNGVTSYATNDVTDDVNINGSHFDTNDTNNINNSTNANDANNTKTENNNGGI